MREPGIGPTRNVIGSDDTANSTSGSHSPATGSSHPAHSTSVSPEKSPYSTRVIRGTPVKASGHSRPFGRARRSGENPEQSLRRGQAKPTRFGVHPPLTPSAVEGEEPGECCLGAIRKPPAEPVNSLIVRNSQPTGGMPESPCCPGSRESIPSKSARDTPSEGIGFAHSAHVGQVRIVGRGPPAGDATRAFSRRRSARRPRMLWVPGAIGESPRKNASRMSHMSSAPRRPGNSPCKTSVWDRSSTVRAGDS